MDRYFEIDQDNWIIGISDGLVSPCAICGKHPVLFDYEVADDLWSMLAPKEHRTKVICLPCFDRLAAEKRFLLGDIRLQFTGQLATYDFVLANTFFIKKENNHA